MNEPINLDDHDAWMEGLRRSRLPRISVVCTGKGSHGSRTLVQFDLDDHGPREVPAREAPFRGGQIDEHTTILNRSIVPARSTRDDYAGRVKYKFQCPIRGCGGAVQVTETRLMELLTDKRNGDTLDISHLLR